MLKARLPLILVLMLALAACTAPAPRPDEATAPDVASGSEAVTPDAGGTGESVPLGEQAFGPDFDFVNDPKSPLNDPQSPLARRIIHFDFDS
ncbi:MAG TPA: hypothetical protein ENK00_05235, partial [Chromatiales bacterium]|nr:hypothetical protein [Chromatiales bacterium]